MEPKKRGRPCKPAPLNRIISVCVTEEEFYGIEMAASLDEKPTSSSWLRGLALGRIHAMLAGQTEVADETTGVYPTMPEVEVDHG